MTQNSNLTPSGELSPGTEEIRPATLSLDEKSTPQQSDLSTSDMSVTSLTPPQSRMASPSTHNLQAENDINMIGGLAAGKALKALGVRWRRLELKDGTPVFALVFPESSWELTPEAQLKPKSRVGTAPNALGEAG